MRPRFWIAGLALGALLSLPAWAGDPVHITSLSLGQSSKALTSGPDSRFVLSATSDGLRAIDLTTFSVVSEAIDVTSVPRDVTVNGGDRPDVVTVNSDGTVSVFYYDLLSSLVDDDLPILESDVPTIQVTQATDTLVAVAADPDSSLVWVADSGSQTVYQVNSQGADSQPELTGVDVLVGRPLRDAIPVLTNVGLRVYVSTSDGLIATVNQGLTALPEFPNAADLTEMASAVVGTSAHVFALDLTNNQVHDINTSGNTLVASNDLPAGSSPVGIASVGHGTETLIAVTFQSPDEVRYYNPQTWTLEYGPISLTGTGGEVTGQDAGYLFAGAGNSVDLITGNPFVTGIDVDPTPILDPEADITLTFTPSLNVDWTLYSGGTLDVAGGDVLGGSEVTTGSAAPDELQQVTVTGTELGLTEGTTPVWVIATENGTGLIGHASGSLSYDLPPGSVEGFHVGYGNGRIFVRWEIPDAEDIDHYDVHFGTDTAASTGVPGIASPQTVEQPENAIPGNELQYRIQPVDNGTTVYAYVVTVDSGGNESAPTPILSATAQETAGVCATADCGHACRVSPRRFGTWPGAALAFLFLGGLFVILIRRRHKLPVRWLAAACAVTLVAGLARPALAREKTPEREAEIADLLSESPKWTSLQLGGGVYLPDNASIQNVYGDVNPAGDFRIGLLLFSIVDLGASVGFQQWSGSGLGVNDGTASDDLFRLTTIPITGTALLRLDFFPNQLVVPYGGGGIAYVDYHERDVYSDVDVRGNQVGTVFIGGLMVLLDSLEPGRAADLDRYWGVNDAYLDIQASRFQFDEGLDLDGWRLTASILFEM